MTYRLAVLGGGKMGTALVQGLLSSGWATPDELLVTEILSHGGTACRRSSWASTCSVRSTVCGIDGGACSP